MITIKKGLNINIDCGLCEVLEIDSKGNYEQIKTDFPNFYLAAAEKKRKEFLKRIDLGAYVGWCMGGRNQKDMPAMASNYAEIREAWHRYIRKLCVRV